MFDYHRGDVLSCAEIARGSASDVYAPTVTYTDRHTMTLGGTPKYVAGITEEPCSRSAR